MMRQAYVRCKRNSQADVIFSNLTSDDIMLTFPVIEEEERSSDERGPDEEPPDIQCKCTPDGSRVGSWLSLSPQNAGCPSVDPQQSQT